jgi:environmental stress-induced protein Ves
MESQMEDFLWRASIAEISADGPFSPFVGVDRTIVLLRGDGVHLKSKDGTVNHRLDTPLEPLAFAGESDISASLIGGASSDFNVMTRRGSATAEVRIVRAIEQLAASRAGVLFAARGTWSARLGGATYSLPENGGAWWDDEFLASDLVPEREPAALIAVRIAR